ncbi:hypothetical protein BD410DRAFT_239413 [Rickenella mellea]|uniref:Uncharacterized protein n=1 Tax=Rickenella mellea TaxID=50990 RepID=A0A4Y7QMT4_9AGAM|nr:hypothetical protein BD410DRAFT_239413 [Rickenella mellea]
MHCFRFCSLVALFSLISSVAAILPRSNEGTIVNLRVEGLDKTTFEGPIFTRGHNVTTASGGDHHCDGTNNGENPKPGPTCTSALDDASRRHGFTFDGTFFAEFDDFFITRIGPDTQTSTQFWGILLNFQFTPVGGCQQQVKFEDQVLFAFDAFNKQHFLKLTGPKVAKAGHPVTLTVTDGSTGTAISGATVDGHTSDANGKVTFTIAKPGVHGFKAEKSDSIRSNKVTIIVD